jgi:predicted DNA-binding protein
MSATTTIRVSAETHQLLTNLARETGTTIQDVTARAAELYRRERLFAAANAAYAAIHAESQTASEWQAELQAWDATLNDGLEPY